MKQSLTIGTLIIALALFFVPATLAAPQPDQPSLPGTSQLAPIQVKDDNGRVLMHLLSFEEADISWSCEYISEYPGTCIIRV